MTGIFCFNLDHCWQLKSKIIIWETK